MQGALALRNVRTAEADALLEEMLDDGEPEVRNAAEEVLLSRFPLLLDDTGLNHQEPQPGERLWLLEEHLFGDKREDAVAAATELREILGALREGATPESLKLYQPVTNIVAHLV